MLWSSGRGYPERRGFPREEKTLARGLVRRRQTLGLAPDIQREQSGISLTLAQSQTPAPGRPHPWEAETGRAGCTQVRLPHHRAVGSLTRPPLLQSPQGAGLSACRRAAMAFHGEAQEPDVLFLGQEGALP